MLSPTTIKKYASVIMSASQLMGMRIIDDEHKENVAFF